MNGGSTTYNEAEHLIKSKKSRKVEESFNRPTYQSMDVVEYIKRINERGKEVARRKTTERKKIPYK